MSWLPMVFPDFASRPRRTKVYTTVTPKPMLPQENQQARVIDNEAVPAGLRDAGNSQSERGGKHGKVPANPAQLRPGVSRQRRAPIRAWWSLWSLPPGPGIRSGMVFAPCCIGDAGADTTEILPGSEKPCRLANSNAAF